MAYTIKINGEFHKRKVDVDTLNETLMNLERSLEPVEKKILHYELGLTKEFSFEKFLYERGLILPIVASKGEDIIYIYEDVS